jgi:hypothetical protein
MSLPGTPDSHPELGSGLLRAEDREKEHIPRGTLICTRGTVTHAEHWGQMTSLSKPGNPGRSGEDTHKKNSLLIHGAVSHPVKQRETGISGVEHKKMSNGARSAHL